MMKKANNLNILLTENNPKPVFIVSDYGRIMYVNLPGMNLLDHLHVNINDRVPQNIWKEAVANHYEGMFTLKLGDTKYQWSAKKLSNGFYYMQVTHILEDNLMFAR